MSINITVFFAVICVWICRSHMYVVVRDPGYKWVNYTDKFDNNSEMIKVSNDIDGSEIVVGCGLFQGQYLPAKAKPTHGVAYASFNGVEYELKNFHILVTNQKDAHEWVDTNHTIPENAVQCGETIYKQPLFVGLYKNPNNVTHIGKVTTRYYTIVGFVYGPAIQDGYACAYNLDVCTQLGF